jgi:hypothetical protein
MAETGGDGGRPPQPTGSEPEGERRPAFYALASGGWRDYWTLLHPPYTLWHLSYVGFGAAVATHIDGKRLAATLVAFFLAVGLSAHALDELSGRPLATRIPRWLLWAIAVVGLAGACVIGVLGAIEVSPWLIAFVVFGAFVVLAYNLELFGGRFHHDLWFALSWGAFPALTSSFAQDATVRPEHVIVAAACFGFSLAQRALSTPVRELRRRTRQVIGYQILDDGTRIPLDRNTLRQAPEMALRAMAYGVVALATGLLVFRFAP